MLDVRTIFHERDVPTHPRGAEILARFPDAELIEVEGHQKDPRLARQRGQRRATGCGSSATRWSSGARTPHRAPAERASADFIAPSSANGCAMACAYCYVPRRKGYANPITVFATSTRSPATSTRHVDRRAPNPPRTSATRPPGSTTSARTATARSTRWSPTTWPTWSPPSPTCRRPRPPSPPSTSTATCSPRTRGVPACASLSCPTHRPSCGRADRPLAERIAAVDDFVERRLRGAPQPLPGRRPRRLGAEYAQLFRPARRRDRPAYRRRAPAEVIFLTHNAGLHEVNLGWHPRGEEVLWRPDVQETKRSQNGMENVRYRARWKAVWVQRLLDLIAGSGRPG